MKRLSCLCAHLVLLSGCGMMGPYRGPEPFGQGRYDVAAPQARLERQVRLVMLVFQDERPPYKHNLDWTRQASNFRSTVGQPDEVRAEFQRALLAGLSRHPGIRVVSADEFLRTQQADLVVGGSVVRCEGRRGKSSGGFEGYSAIRVSLRDGKGQPVWDRAHVFTGHGYAQGEHLSDPPVQTIYDIKPGAAAAAVEGSIAAAASDFLSSPDFAGALQNAGR